jgi:hypothetical protein
VDRHRRRRGGAGAGRAPGDTSVVPGQSVLIDTRQSVRRELPTYAERQVGHADYIGDELKSVPVAASMAWMSVVRAAAASSMSSGVNLFSRASAVNGVRRRRR